MTATASLLTTVVATADAILVEAYVNGQRGWLRFAGADRARAQETVLVDHAEVMAGMDALGIAGISRDTRVLLGMRFQAEPTTVPGISAPVFNATRWLCQPRIRLSQPRAAAPALALVA